MKASDGAAATFTFQPRWKEEMVVTHVGASFVLEFSMGVPTIYLPTEDAWRAKSPPWATHLWTALRGELEHWCQANKVALEIDPTAGVF